MPEENNRNSGLTIADFRAAFNEIEAIARWHITTDGFTQEMLIAFAANGKADVTTNFTSVPLARQPELVRSWLRRVHAVAAISVCEGYLAWRSDDGPTPSGKQHRRLTSSSWLSELLPR